jgi:Uma2 family endonuclease
MELQLDLNTRYSYADYLTWLDDTRRELINGFIKMMSPAPAKRHQTISGNLFGEIKWYLKGKKCKVFNAPFDVRLPNKQGAKTDDQVFTVVQPDICVICDPSKLDERGCLGSPDFIIEIISPASAKKDVEEKFYIYQEAGVREYWIVYPQENSVSVFFLNEFGKYQLVGMYAEDSIVKVNIFDNFSVQLKDIFEE